MFLKNRFFDNQKGIGPKKTTAGQQFRVNKLCPAE